MGNNCCSRVFGADTDQSQSTAKSILSEQAVQSSNSTILLTSESGIIKIDDITTKYRLGKLLGKGAFGQVYKCTNKLTSKVCAMKIMKKSSLQGNQELITMIENELLVI